MMNKIFIAGNFERRAELAVFANLVRGQGYHITSSWLYTNEEDADQDSWSTYAKRDAMDIYDADVFILFTEATPPQRNSRLVEMGYALAYGKHVVVIGPIETIYCTLADEIYDTKQEFLETLGKEI